jgi:PKD repeat protein
MLHARWRSGWALAAILLGSSSGGLPGEISPRAVSPAGARALKARLAVDAGENAFIAMVVDGKVRVVTVGSAISADRLLSEIKIPEDDPAIEVGPLAAAFVAFTQEDNELGSSGREIFLAANPGGSFGPPRNVSENQVDDRRPSLSLDRTGSPRLAWAEGPADDPRILYLDPARPLPPQVAASGDWPSIAVDGAGVHLAFSRAEAILVADQDGETFLPPVEVDRAAPGEAPAPRIGADSGGRLSVVYLASGELRMAVRPSSGSFAHPLTLDPGPLVDDAGLDAHLRADGRITISYRKGGEVFVARGELEGPLEPQPVTRGAEAEGPTSAREDRHGFLHLSFLHDGTVYYANTAGPVAAELGADPPEGELPLEVQFRDLSSGEVRAWRWSFGDGTTSSEANPVHVYARTGLFDVSLEVLGPGGQSRVEKSGLIKVREPSNTMTIGEDETFPGEKGVWLPVFGYHRDPIQGFQTVGSFDPQVLELSEVTFLACAPQRLDPEFFVVEVQNQAGYFTSGLLFDYNPPYDGRQMPGGSEERLLYLVLNVLPTAPPGLSEIKLGGNLGPSHLSCMYAVEGLSRLPVLYPGRVRVLPAAGPHPLRFIRGDSDGNGRVNLTDAVELLAVLFSGGSFPGCADASDTNDSGEIDISDVIYLLSSLFLGSGPLPAPYPVPGLDPTADDLPPCTG